MGREIRVPETRSEILYHRIGLHRHLPETSKTLCPVPFIGADQSKLTFTTYGQDKIEAFVALDHVAEEEAALVAASNL